MALPYQLLNPQFHYEKQSVPEGTQLEDFGSQKGTSITDEGGSAFAVSDGAPKCHQRASKFHLFENLSSVVFSAGGKMKKFALYTSTSVRDTSAAFAKATVGLAEVDSDGKEGSAVFTTNNEDVQTHRRPKQGSESEELKEKEAQRSEQAQLISKEYINNTQGSKADLRIRQRYISRLNIDAPNPARPE
ncbi:hypothetical protein JQC92_05320 [Shewanella sp. 202IG2-18]|uniref:hypothetical protein n=1 Tax=Parashewanella hymeniacidonis TaxID=2807618 RepID=UPI00195F2F0E|nr:hypothetical protein [Parashewanella hymeniacidonis]MBM7071457.1 hypothetical protein [Parashewanella hymeniacidonis]